MVLCCGASVANPPGKRPGPVDILRTANCAAQTAIQPQLLGEFTSDGVFHFRYFEGGVPHTSQETLDLQTIVLYSNDMKQTLVVTTEQASDKQIKVLPIVDYFRLNGAAWTPVEASGGPGTADATAEFLDKLPRKTPLHTAKLMSSPESECIAAEPK